MIYEKIKDLVDREKDIEKLELGEVAYDNLINESRLSYVRNIDGKNKTDYRMKKGLIMFKYRLYFNEVPLVANRKLEQNEIKIVRKRKKIDKKIRGLSI